MIPKFSNDIIETWDGHRVRRASMMLRGVTIAVDLSIAVAAACMGVFVVALVVPLDDPGARIPLGAVVVAAMLYLIAGRDYLVSPGRRIFGLQLYRLPGNVAGLMGRSLMAWPEHAPKPERDPLPRSIFAIVLSTLLGAMCVAAAVTNTHVYRFATDHLTVHGATGVSAPVGLGSVPRAVLIGSQRSYVQLGATDGAGEPVLLEVFLAREAGAWRVVRSGEAGQALFARFSLGAADEDIPRHDR